MILTSYCTEEFSLAEQTEHLLPEHEYLGSFPLAIELTCTCCKSPQCLDSCRRSRANVDPPEGWKRTEPNARTLQEPTFMAGGFQFPLGVYTLAPSCWRDAPLNWQHSRPEVTRSPMWIPVPAEHHFGRTRVCRSVQWPQVRIAMGPNTIKLQLSKGKHSIAF